MADFLLVHGSCHGAWCWRDAIPALARLGHSAHAIDLPGHGDDSTPVEEITLDACRDAILAASTPGTIIVGHSWGGYPISAAAEAAPDAMRGLIYLCAYVPVSGLSMIDMRRRGPRQTITGAVIRDPSGLSYRFDPAQAPDLFYNDCPAEVLTFALRRLGSQAIDPQDTPLTLGASFARVPRHYVRCTGDRVIPPEYQAAMVADWPRETVHEMDTGHSPFFADPRGLADVLDRIAGAMG